MKKKVISFLLALILAGSIAAATAGQAKAVSYGSFGIGHDSSSGLSACEVLPYAYYAMEFGSLEYYIAHFNIRTVYNAAELEAGFNRSITTSIFNSLENGSGQEQFKNDMMVAVNNLLDFGDTITEADLYDNILISMLLGQTVENLSSDSAFGDIFDTLQDVLESGITVIDNGVPTTMKFIDYLNTLGSVNSSRWKDFWAALKSFYAKSGFSGASMNSMITLAFDGKTVQIQSGPLDELLSAVSGEVLSSNMVSQLLTLLEVIIDATEEFTELVNNCAFSLVIWKTLGPDAEAFLREMLEFSTNKSLKAAINKYLFLMIDEESICDLVLHIHQQHAVAESFAEWTVSYAMTFFKVSVAACCLPYAAAAVSWTIMDLLGGNYGDRSEMIFIVKALHEVDTAVVQAMKSLEAQCTEDYTSKDSAELCKAYNTGMLMSWRLQSCELTYAQKYMEAHYGKSDFNKYFGENDAWDDWLENIEAQQELLDNIKPAAYRDTAIGQFDYLCETVNNGLTIRYDLNGGTGTIPDQTKPFFGAVNLSTVIPVKEGYTFKGWTIKGYELYPYSAGELLTGFLKGETVLDDAHRLEPCLCCQELVLTAAWTTETLIVYNANGGTGAPASQTVTPGTAVLSADIPTREGFSFLGWATAPDAAEAEYQPGDEISVNGTVNLYAVWQAGSFNIVFDANGGTFETAGGTAIVRQKTYLQPFAIDVEAPVRSGYTFAGLWSLNADGSGTTYTHNQVYSDIGGAGLSTKTLYAVWTDTTADILYDYADDPSGQNVTTARDALDVSQGITAYTVQKPTLKSSCNGCSFKGWIVQDPNGKYWWANAYADNGPCSVYQPGDQVWLSGDLVLYAKWTWLIHYDHDIEGGPYVHEETGSSTYTVAAPAYTREGMAFLHWLCIGEDGVAVYYKPGDQLTLTSDLYLTAIWVDAATGTVTDESGNPLEGAVVEFIGSDGTSAGAVVTDSTGTYSFVFNKTDTYQRIFTMPNYAVLAVDGLEAGSYLTSMGTTALPADNMMRVRAAGSCGELAAWHLVSDLKGNTILSIVGIGATESYDWYGCGPWESYVGYGNDIVINRGITAIGDWAFYDVEASSVTLPDTLLSIGKGAFYRLGMVKEIILPDSLVAIDLYAFAESSLTGITIPKNVRSLCDSQWAFQQPFRGCPHLTEIKVAEENPYFCSVDGVLYTKDLTTLLSYPPARNSGTLVIPEGVIRVNDDAFSSDSSTAPLQVTIPSTLTEVSALSRGAYFTGYTVAKDNPVLCSQDGVVFSKDMKTLMLYPRGKADLSYTVPDGVTAIGSQSFYMCDHLVTLTLPEGLERIEYSAFYQCEVLSNLIIPDSVTSLGSHALDQCWSLASVYFMGDLPAMEYGAIYPVHSSNTMMPGSKLTLYYIEGKEGWTSPTLTVTDYSRQDTYNTAVFDPDEVDFTVAYSGSCGDDLTFELSTDMVLTVRGTGAMYDYSAYTMPWYSYRSIIREITVKSGATTVGNYAFSQMGKLTKVTLPDTIVYLAYYSLYANDSLTSINLPAKLKTIYDGAFWGCGLEKIVIPDSVTSIGEEAFEFCEKLTSVDLPDGLTALEINTFAYCRALTSINLPDTLTTIGGSAFRNCEALTEIALPAGVETIGSNAFEQCNSLRQIKLPQRLTSIGSRAFANCEALTEVVLPDSVTSLGTYAFYRCSALEKVTLSAGLTAVPDNTFYLCSSLARVDIPVGITSIGSNAFRFCGALTELVLPEGLTSVGSNALAYCDALTSITFPASFQSLGSSALSGATGLTGLYFYGNAPTSWAFEGLRTSETNEITVYYRAGTTGWTTPTWRAPSGTTFKTALWLPADSTPVSALKVSGSNQVTCTVSDGARFTRLLVGAYDAETDRFLGTAMGLYDGSTNTVTVTFDFELPAAYVLRVFCMDDSFDPQYEVGTFPSEP